MATLFDEPQKFPLAERLRPQTLAQYQGQAHLVGKNGVISKLLQSDKVPSMILWGPPGVGKTTLARLIGNHVKTPFFTLSAINSGVKEVRQVIEKAKTRAGSILFIDEIHRFNKAQQDALLGAVETGLITLIGATTENPSFEVISALQSRCQIYILQPLSPETLVEMLENAQKQDEWLKKLNIKLKETEALLNLSGGDARRLLNLFELVVSAFPANQDPLVITNEWVLSTAQQKTVRYDKTGEQHYDIVSAFIKSIRGSDPNAAVYWLARMIEGGEDPKFIARRLVISASEDIGNANPTALVIATNCFQAVTMVGYPEAEIILAQATTYLAASAKSNASYMSIKKAKELVRKKGDLPIPLHLRNAPTQLMREQGYGKGYQYAHDYPHNFSPQEYLPEAIAHTTLYDPGQNARENELRKRLKNLWQDKYGY
ncbi:replication-associated recombination protein A [Microscilla marina]|uniref:Replication-associated recombination protein A n=1 Tax=Microscilla marina ATCC 23134 TaxID=313606 RepID=A1ZXN0_MICM2|nr:replication-associated recombination protein A [Microscilla marina]EAY24808.1 ATPase, AAA family [Microscilla marina ATCC 23134]